LLSVLKSNASALEMLYMANNNVSEDLIDEAAEESKAAFQPPASASNMLPRDEL